MEDPISAWDLFIHMLCINFLILKAGTVIPAIQLHLHNALSTVEVMGLLYFQSQS